jgi:hypothetical protein
MGGKPNEGRRYASAADQRSDDKFQIILSLCHASFSPMSHLVF